VVVIYFFGDPLDKILSEGQKRCAEDREEKMQRFAEEGKGKRQRHAV
jgi:hypothetical protein